MLKFQEKTLTFIPSGKSFYTLVKRNGPNVVHKEIKKYVAVSTYVTISHEKEYVELLTEEGLKIMSKEI